jgi:flagellin-like hook-associated protein FlgL
MNPLTSGSSSASSGILQSLASNQSLTTDIQTQLTTNKKILDPAQQGVVTRLGSQVTSFGASHNNIAKAQNVLSVAQTGLKSIANLLTQMQDLANKASDATMTSTDSAKLNQTFQSLLTQLDSTAKNTMIDGTGLLNNTAADLTIQTGLTTSDTTDIHAVASDSTTLAITGGITDAATAKATMDLLKTALDTVSTSQSTVASDQIALSTQDDLISSISQNLQNTIDSIQKPDAAALQMQLQNTNNQQSMNYYLINQMNQEAQSVLTIFR